LKTVTSSLLMSKSMCMLMALPYNTLFNIVQNWGA
jgi:hypothetical protein